jgi:hypothetical protein
MKATIAFPIEGFSLDVTRFFSVGKVTFELNDPKIFPKLDEYINGIKILGIVTVES